MNYQEIIKKLTSGEIHTGAMVAGGVLLLVLALKTAKGLGKFLFVLVALALFGGALWWHFHSQR